MLGRGNICQIGKVKHFFHDIRNAVLLERYRVRSAGNRHFHRVVCRELVVLVRRQSSGSDIFARFYHCAVIAYRQFHAVAVHKVGRLDGNRLLCLAVIFECGFAIKRKREFALFNRQRCRLICNQFIVLAIAFERCRYGIFASVDLLIARVFGSHAVGQVRCQDRVRLPVIGYGFIFKDNRAHIVKGFLDSQRCRLACNRLVVCAIAFERCRYFIFASVNLLIACVLCRHAVGQVRCQDRVCLPVVGYGVICKDNRAHIVNGFFDGQRCRQLGQIGVVAVGASERCRNGVGICVDLFVIRVVNRHAVRKCSCDEDRFFRAVVGKFAVVEGNARQIACANSELRRHIRDCVVVLTVTLENRRYGVFARLRLVVILVVNRHAVGQVGRFKGIDFARVVHALILEHHARHIIGCLVDE